MRERSRQGLRELFSLVAVALLAVAAAVDCAAQSGDVNFPTPIFSNEVTGRIAPRDVGDARRTRHFYTFRGVEGDLVISLESSELTGAVDVFTATTSRPLLNITLLGGARTLASKSVYLRAEETLVLRVEARAVSDAEGSYRIRLEGAFAPAPTSLADTPAPEAPTVSNTERRRGGTRRVTSTGARIDEPAPPPAEEAKAEPTPTPSEAGRAETRETTPAPRRGRATRPPPRRARGRATPAPTTRPEDTTDAARTETPTSEGTTAEAKPETETPARTPRRRGSRSTPRRSSTRERADTTPPPAEPAPPAAPSQRLIIVTRDGETLERDMSTVRRVTVENNQVVVVTRDGRTTRTPMANILKMSIEP